MQQSADLGISLKYNVETIVTGNKRDMHTQKETGKILYRKFLPENIGLLLIEPVYLAAIFVISDLYQFPAEYVFYLTSIFLILWVIVLCIQYRMFRRRLEQYEKALKEVKENNLEENIRWQELQEKQDFFALWAHQIKTPSFSKSKTMWRWL